MKLKVNESTIVPNLQSVHQSYDQVNNFDPGTIVTFSDVENIDSLVKNITTNPFNEVTVLNDNDEVVTTFKVGEIISIDKAVNPDLQIMIRFS